MDLQVLRSFSRELQKIAEEKTSSLMMAAGMSDFKAKKKDDGKYQHVRDWGWRGAQGAATGAGIAQLSNNLKDSTKAMTTKGYRRGAAIGASVALGDRLWRHRKDFGGKDGREKDAFVQASPGGSFGSPATALANASKTGKFRSQIHTTGTAPKSLQMGQKFRLNLGAL